MGTGSDKQGEMETPRLILRLWREADFEPFAEFWGDGECTRYVGGPISRDVAWSRFLSFIGHWEIRDFGYFVLEERQTSAVVGYCGFRLPLNSYRAELGWAIYSSFRGRGFATEAAAAALRFGFDAVGGDDIVSLIDNDNLASIAVAKKLGGMPASSDRDGAVYRYRSRDCDHAE